MVLTEDFRETILRRARRDAGFRLALLQEAVECIAAGELEVGKSMLRNYINASRQKNLTNNRNDAKMHQ